MRELTIALATTGGLGLLVFSAVCLRVVATWNDWQESATIFEFRKEIVYLAVFVGALGIWELSSAIQIMNPSQ